jgi:hypothetical protein
MTYRHSCCQYKLPTIFGSENPKRILLSPWTQPPDAVSRPEVGRSISEGKPLPTVGGGSFVAGLLAQYVPHHAIITWLGGFMIFQRLQERWVPLFLFVFLLAGASLACNTPFSDVEPSPTKEPQAKEVPDTPIPPDPTLDTEQDFTPGSPATVPIIIETPEATQPQATPSNTPAFEIPTLAATVTASHTPTRRPQPTRTRDGSGTPSATEIPGSAGPLTFHFEIVWRPHPTDPTESIATVTVDAEGGGGGYRYYLALEEMEGPVFEYTWRNCMGNPQSLTVTSADGQSVKVDYYENPPCPTPTPIP